MNEVCALSDKGDHKFISYHVTALWIPQFVTFVRGISSHHTQRRYCIAMCQNQRAYVRESRWESDVAEAGKPNVIVYSIVYCTLPKYDPRFGFPPHTTSRDNGYPGGRGCRPSIQAWCLLASSATTSSSISFA